MLVALGDASAKKVHLGQQLLEQKTMVLGKSSAQRFLELVLGSAKPSRVSASNTVLSPSPLISAAKIARPDTPARHWRRWRA